MSGGSYNCFYSKLSDMADSIREIGGLGDGYCARPALRRAFAAHLQDCAEACRAIEWNDSGDGDDREESLIRKCIAPDQALKQATVDAQAALTALTDELGRALAGR